MRKLNAEQRQQIENYLEAVQHLAFVEEERACGDCVPLEQPKTRYHGKTQRGYG